MRSLILAASVAVLSLVTLLFGCDAVAPTTIVDLSLAGTVRDAETDEVVPGAVVELYVLNEDITTNVLARTTTGDDGRYTLSHRLEDVATEEELGGNCAVWNDGQTSSVSLTVLAEGYFDALFVSKSVACIETPDGGLRALSAVGGFSRLLHPHPLHVFGG